MTLPISTTHLQFTQLAQELFPPIHRLQTHLAAVAANENIQTALNQAVTDLHQIKDIASKLLAIQALTLYEAEYMLFCDLIICGSEMAAHFASNPNASKTMQQHGQYWQKSVKEFKSFLQEVLAKHGNKSV